MLLDIAKWMFINLMVAVGLAFLAAYPPVLRRLKNTTRYPWRDVVVYCATAVFCILFPWKGSPGLQLDLRFVIIALAGWTSGMGAALPVAAVSVVTRMLLGGIGALPAALMTLGVLALTYLFSDRPRTYPWLLAMGLSQAGVVFLGFQTLVPIRPDWAQPLSPVWLLEFAVNAVGAVMVNGAFEHVKATARLQAQLSEELRAREAVLELIPYGILFLDHQGRVTGSNQAARNLIGETRISPEILSDPEIARALAERLRVHGRRITYAGGDQIVQVSAVPTADGAVVGIENVTGTVRQEREEARQERLELLGQLAAMAAHEIKNPLTTIKGFLQLLDGRPHFAEYRSAFALLQTEVETINRVVGDFLMLSGQASPQTAQIALDDVVAELLEVMGLQHPSGGVRPRVSGVPGVTLTGDPKAIKQIVRNLLANAYEAMPDGGDLYIHTDCAGGYITVTISDTGAGIAPEMLPHIFRPYMTTKATGTGLGLAISHRLTKEMGGSLDVTSQAGQGSTFYLRLPQGSATGSAAS